MSPLLALLFAFPVVSSSTVPTTLYDPFHDIAVHVPKPPEPPICCLRPLSPLENTEEEVLLSFDEWKAKQMAMHGEHATGSQTGSSLGQKPGNTGPIEAQPEPNISSVIPGSSGAGSGGPTTLSFEQTEASPPNAPYFRIPLTDRFNYASTDCSARAHTAHKSAKSVYNILSSKRDKYMLSPCAEKSQFIVVELCDDIRIDTIQLANFEFFSGVFKDFTVSFAKTYTTDTDGWTFAGTYHAKNTRSVQSFHPPTTLGDFYRFIRIDFHSHYGNEYYCPLSLLRVYGLTHLEHWKWDLWEAESRAKRPAEEANVVPVEIIEQPPQPAHVPAFEPADTTPKSREPIVPATPRGEEGAQEKHTSLVPVEHMNITHEINNKQKTGARSPDSATALSLASQATSFDDSSLNDSGTANLTLGPTSSTPSHAPSTDGSVLNSSSSLTGQKSQDITNDRAQLPTTGPLYHSLSVDSSSASVSISLSQSLSSGPSASYSQSPISSTSSSTSTSTSATANQSSQTTRPVSASPISTSLHSVSVVSPIVPSSSGESIYRTIMNRLTALETNTTLYARFVEDHTASVREMLRRLSEDVGRLEAIGKAQAQIYQRSVAEFQQRQRRLELEHGELLSRIVRLNDEVVLEKRLGIVQLCLLLTVLVFMALTRGSRSEPLQGPHDTRSRTHSLRGWGSRTLNLSTDLVSKLKSGSRSPPESINGHVRSASDSFQKPSVLEQEIKIALPSQGVQTAGIVPPRSKRSHAALSSWRVGGFARPHTPNSPRTFGPRHYSPSPSTPKSRAGPSRAATGLPAGGARPRIQRAQSGSGIVQSFSMDTIGPVPKSAKRWARTAHLHPVKSAGLGGAKGQAEGEGAHVWQLNGAESDDGLNKDVFAARGRKEDREREFWEDRRNGELGGHTKGTQSDSTGRKSSLKFPVVGRLSDIEPEANEGDGWTDTDVEDSRFLSEDSKS